MTTARSDDQTDVDLVDAGRPLQGEERRQLARQRTLYLAASLMKKGFSVDLPAPAPGEEPSLRYLRETVSLLRLLTHGERLFTQVLPPIRACLSFARGRAAEARRFSSRGPVDWPSTQRTALLRGEPHPTTLFSRCPTRDHTTAENLLAVLTIHAVRTDVEDLSARLRGRLQPRERSLLGDLIARADRMHRVPQLVTLCGHLPSDLTGNPDGPAARRLEVDVRHRARRQRTLAPYLELVAWREQYRAWLNEARRSAAARTASWHQNDHKLYEILVLFELATAISQRSCSAVQERGVGESVKRPVFRFRLRDGRALDLWYQAGTALPRQVTTMGAQPDVLIRLGDRAVIGDMKNYSPDNHPAGLYKLLGYLYQFGYPDRWEAIAGAVAFFPAPSRQHHGYRQLDTLTPGAHWIASLIVPFAGLDPPSQTWMEAFLDDLLADPSGLSGSVDSRPAPDGQSAHGCSPALRKPAR